jgi:hypothetical protein
MTAISATIFLVSLSWTLITVRILENMTELALGPAAAFSVFVIVVFLCRGRAQRRVVAPARAGGGAAARSFLGRIGAWRRPTSARASPSASTNGQGRGLCRAQVSLAVEPARVDPAGPRAAASRRRCA